MSDSRIGNDGADTGGLPVGRLASERAGATGSPAPRARQGLFSAALPMIILALVTGLALGLAIGLLINRGNTQEPATTTTAPGASTTLAPDGTSTTSGGAAPAYGVVTVSGTALPVLQQGVEDTAVGLAVPEINGADFDGNARAINANGNGKLIVALAHWCPYCNQELPVLGDWYSAADLPANVEVILLNVFTDPTRDNFPPSTWLAQSSWSGPVIADDAAGSLASALGIASVPYNLLVTPEGTVTGRITGGLSVEQLDSAVEYLAGLSTTTTTP
jgi:cytochrome c biogenesis protein CcmG/thiol:disulfide interchange protein DsbE